MNADTRLADNVKTNIYRKFSNHFQQYLLCCIFSLHELFIKLLNTLQRHVQLHKLLRLIPCYKRHCGHEHCISFTLPNNTEMLTSKLQTETMHRNISSTSTVVFFWATWTVNRNREYSATHDMCFYSVSLSVINFM